MERSSVPDYLRRESGILLHPTSLPGPHGIGDLGAEARRFVDFLQAAGQRLWQILPLGPVGYGNSPYASTSAMAGNPLLISLDQLREEGLLSWEELTGAPAIPADRVNYPAVESFKVDRLRRAYRRFLHEAGWGPKSALDGFRRSNASWLADYALFAAIQEVEKIAPWNLWEREVATRQPHVLERRRQELGEEIGFQEFAQFQFFRQWEALKRYANDRGVRIVGDIPIFVSLHSADVWSRPGLFHLDESGHPTLVSGVPPDYFSKTGQRWGNPLYRWEVMTHEGYSWWIERFRMALKQVDLIRIDHFRGFEAYWEVPAEQKTAEHGRWVKGPGEQFFRAMAAALGSLPVIAEDLGLITPEVLELRLTLGYPGMKVLHFAFDSGPANPYLPHNYEQGYVAYTGTHDNDTTLGWFSSRPPHEQRNILRYIHSSGHEIHWELIRLLLTSVADAAIMPLQDVLGLGSSARMNVPGRAEGNWDWRYTPDQLRPEHAERLRELCALYGRLQ